MTTVREPAVAGIFCPNDAAALSAMISTYTTDTTDTTDTTEEFC